MRKKKNVKSKKKGSEDMFCFHEWKQQLLVIDLFISIIVVLSLGILRPDFVLIAIWFLIIPYLFITKRSLLIYQFALASVMSLIWIFLANDYIRYNVHFITILTIDLYHLFAVAIGLFTAFLLYSHYEHMLHEKGYLKKLGLYLLFYWPLLLLFQGLAFHGYEIHKINPPLWIEIGLLLIGPVYFSFCYLLNIKNPHYKLKITRK